MAEQQTVTPLAVMALSLAADARAADAVTILEEAGIPCLLLKGASLAEWLYGSDIRGYHDADLMVSPDKHETAEVALTQAGFALQGRHLHASVWRSPGDPVTIDLHRQLWASGISPTFTWKVLWGRSVPQSIGGRDVRVLDPTARALVVALHHAHHSQLGQGTLRTSSDLARTLDVLDASDWEAVDDLAHDLRARLHLASGLRSLDDRRGGELADRLKLPDERMLQTATQPDATVPLVGAIVTFRAARGARRKLRALGQEILPPADDLRDRSALARRGTAGLLLAYLLAPFVSLAHLPSVLTHLRGVLRGRRQ